MKISGSGCVIVVVYICMSQKSFVYTSGLARSEEKKTDAVTVFSSTSIPAFWHACLMIACAFCRGWLTDVW